MPGEKNIKILLKYMNPIMNEGTYVFVSQSGAIIVSREDTIAEFKEKEGTTLIHKKETADAFGLVYDFVCAWITLRVHSSMDGVGLTAAFSNALALKNISCNVVAGYHQDHIFVNIKDADLAMLTLEELSIRSVTD